VRRRPASAGLFPLKVPLAGGLAEVNASCKVPYAIGACANDPQLETPAAIIAT